MVQHRGLGEGGCCQRKKHGGGDTQVTHDELPEIGVLHPSYGTGAGKKSAQVTLHCGMNRVMGQAKKNAAFRVEGGTNFAG